MQHLRPEASQAKRAAVLKTATLLFSRYGFRKTSIDLLAKEARVAKPTVYAYFGDKDGLFAAVCGHVGAEILAAARDAAEEGAPLPERVAAVLSAKFTKVFELVDSSPHARDFLEAQHGAARRSVEEANAAYLELLTQVLRAAAEAGELDLGRLGLSPAELARQLMLLGYGAGYGAASAEEHRGNLKALVATVLRAGAPA